jgi:MFS family permease
VSGVTSEEQKYFWRVVLPTGLTMLVCNMDRICMSVAMIPMSKEFSWSPSVQGLIQSAFLWGYMATTLLGGKLADVHGGRKVIAIAIAFFSIASLCLPALASVVPPHAALAAVVASRFLGASVPCLQIGTEHQMLHCDLVIACSPPLHVQSCPLAPSSGARHACLLCLFLI